jgi:hypothetical protein
VTVIAGKKKKGKLTGDDQDHRIFAQQTQPQGHTPQIPPARRAVRDEFNAAVDRSGPEEQQGCIRGLNDAARRKEQGDIGHEDRVPWGSGIIRGEPAAGPIEKKNDQERQQEAADPHGKFIVSDQTGK